ncbi:MAG: hypothetical protein SCK29_07250 [Bacillota bacterium]|nr:hypothetical protein [Bacillota bacterium]MDW7683895.1 hypothetical protein [Bacillota bacterium]
MPEQICPYCNGLSPLEILCPACSTPMDDCGTLQEALGPYAPYEENSLVHARFDCVHQVFCPNCRIEYLLSVPSGYTFSDLL